MWACNLFVISVTKQIQNSGAAITTWVACAIWGWQSAVLIQSAWCMVLHSAYLVACPLLEGGMSFSQIHTITMILYFVSCFCVLCCLVLPDWIS